MFVVNVSLAGGEFVTEISQQFECGDVKILLFEFDGAGFEVTVAVDFANIFTDELQCSSPLPTVVETQLLSSKVEPLNGILEYICVALKLFF